MTEHEALEAVRQDIARIKAKLARKAARSGVWEYFGQREGRQLQDRYSGHFLGPVGHEICNFLEWAEDYTTNG